MKEQKNQKIRKNFNQKKIFLNIENLTVNEQNELQS